MGTPQGRNLSPLLANIMLNELDKEMEKRGLNFVRYADNCIIMVRSEVESETQDILSPAVCQPCFWSYLPLPPQFFFNIS